jgi:membrane dipeptidase
MRDEKVRAYWKSFRDENPIGFADVSDVADHIDHVARLVGVDHVGFGSDFDGLGDSLPTGLKDVSHYPNLILELLKRGYTDDDIRKICSENILRVWSDVERAAGDTR